MTEPCIDRALVAPGHDGSAELIVYLRFANGACSSVMLGSDVAERLMDRCGVTSPEGLRGHPWNTLLDVLD